MASLDAFSTGNDTNTDTLTVSHTVGSGSDRRMIVVTGTECSGEPSVSSVTYNSDNLTFVDNSQVGSSFRNEVEVWEMKDADLPSTGAYNVVVTWNSGTSSQHRWVGIWTLEDATQDDFVAADTDTVADESVDSLTFSTGVSVESDDYVIVGESIGQSGTFTSPTGYTQRGFWNQGGSAHSGEDKAITGSGTETPTLDPPGS